ncbi:hypothetical protein KTT58_17215 [Pseudomonas viridiflava]|uniref:hypothetical protein n=1 Tax=Pseudomonas viridiflava TaxID=33069 RepID=UPI001C2D45BA|nr:hypothetical protein [Pseudomonas viridiflava]MBV1814487.1 hypothetical protein [Pseudomonas viridiflava]
MNKDDGGPAFPLKEPLTSDSTGMSLRDYFAANAPSIPFAWFAPNMDSAEPELVGTQDLETGEMRNSNHREIQAWVAERYKQACIQWPYAWADLMLAARNA